MRIDSLFHPLLGHVDIVVRLNAKRFIARYAGDGRVRLTVPPGCGEAEILRALESLAPRLLARKRPDRPLYSDGMVVEQPGIRIEICSVPDVRGGVVLSGNVASARILVDSSLDMSERAVCRSISGLMMRVARHRAAAVLPEQADAIAASLGLRPRSWRISTGMRTLGRCNACGDIGLSAALMYLPVHLRRYVICHELAHLTEMNHSARFHALCDSYCGGREHALAAELKAFSLPLLR